MANCSPYMVSTIYNQDVDAIHGIYKQDVAPLNNTVRNTENALVCIE